MKVDYQGKTEKPLRIFLSYGHDANNPIAERIKRDLELRGHSVWFDREQIEARHDWRARIIKGLIGDGNQDKGSDGVLALLSDWSVREGGVCRDELGIAVSERAASIATVLLEASCSQSIPSTITALQYVDMSIWRTVHDNDMEQFEEYYQEKFKEIVRTVEGRIAYQTADEIDKLRKILAPKITNSKLKDLIKSPLIGRTEFVKEVERWQNSELSSPALMIYGDAGVGKSRLMVELGYCNPQALALVFCEWSLGEYSTPRSIITMLAYSIALRCGSYRAWLLAQPEAALMSERSESEMFDYFLANPLADNPNGGMARSFIYIDGLDEARGSNDSSGDVHLLAEVLSRNIPRLPRWISFVISSRNIASVRSAFQFADELNIDSDSELNKRDVRRYFSEALGALLLERPDAESILNKLTELSEGVFLYAKLASEDILCNPQKIEYLDALPRGLGSFYHEWFVRLFGSVENYHQSGAHDVLSLIVASPEPVPEPVFLKAVPGYANSLIQIGGRFESMLKLIELSMADDSALSLQFVHKSLPDWIVNRELEPLFFINKQNGLDILAQCCYSSYCDKRMELYELVNAEELLLGSGRQSCWQEMSADYWYLGELENAARRYWTVCDFNAAMKLYRRVVVLYQNAISRCSDIELRQAYANALGQQCQLLREVGLLNEALKSGERSIKEWEAIIEIDPSLGKSANYAKALNGLGYATLDLGDFDRAQAKCAEAATVWQGLADEMLLIEYQSEWATALNGCGYAQIRLGLLRDAETVLRQAVRIAGEVVGECDSEYYRNELARMYNNLSYALREMAKLEESLSACRQSVRIREEAVKVNPKVANRNDLARTLNNCVHILRAQGEFEEALKFANCAVELREGIVSQASTLAYRDDLGRSLNALGYVLRGMGKTDESLIVFRRALRLREEMVGEANSPIFLDKPSYSAYDCELATALSNVARALYELRAEDLGLSAALRAVEVHRALRERSEQALYSHESICSLNVLACILVLSNELDDAIRYSQEAVEASFELINKQCSVTNYFLLDEALSCMRLTLCDNNASSWDACSEYELSAQKYDIKNELSEIVCRQDFGRL